MCYIQTMLVIALSFAVPAICICDEPRVEFQLDSDRVHIQVNGDAIATYVLSDDTILRPYLAHVRTPSKVQVTRNHPPLLGDRTDHASMHPGIWLAFGDIQGHDFWRNVGRVEHRRFLQAPSASGNHGSFSERKRYVARDGTLVCSEEFRLTVKVEAESFLFSFDSIFSSSEATYFGDQEEMGLGIRVATAMSEEAYGQLQDASGRIGAEKIWGESSNWRDYSGIVDGERVGITIFCHPSNFRPCWFHARSYGLLVANPFGRNAMKKGPKSKLVFGPDMPLRLRYGVLVHCGLSASQIEAAYQEYVKPAR